VTASGSFAIRGDLPDRGKALATLRVVPGHGLDLIDTADSYGPFVSEELIREALQPYDGVVIATKGGLTRHGPDIWRPVGNPDDLRRCVLMSLPRLGVGAGAVALAWLLRRSPVMLPIPGTGDPDHLARNAAGAAVRLSADEFEALLREGRAAWDAR